MIIEAILIGIFLISVMLFLACMFEVRHRMAERRATIEWLGMARQAFIQPRHGDSPEVANAKRAIEMHHLRHPDIPTVHISESGRATYNDAAEDIFRRAADGDDPHLGA